MRRIFSLLRAIFQTTPNIIVTEKEMRQINESVARQNSIMNRDMMARTGMVVKQPEPPFWSDEQ